MFSTEKKFFDPNSFIIFKIIFKSLSSPQGPDLCVKYCVTLEDELFKLSEYELIPPIVGHRSSPASSVGRARDS